MINKEKKTSSHINVSLDSEIFTKIWKISFVIPIFEMEDEKNVCTYKDICIHSAIPEFSNAPFSSENIAWACKRTTYEQHGFTGQSSATNLLCFQDFLLGTFEHNLQVNCVSTDF